ncbi:hypothetical protein [Catellatospora methionotrophica]|nr:hypothetical protein [Catellatospora methionotrophica]
MRTPAMITALLLVAAVGLTGCGPDELSMEEAEARYGKAPRPDSSITLDPDVVLIDGGPTAIRGIDPARMTITLDGDAGGVADLKPGKVLFASALAVGRVVRTAAEGDDVVVTIAPVDVTDVIRDGHLQFDEELSFGQASIVDAGTAPGGYEYTDISVKDDPSPATSAPAPASPAAFGRTVDDTALAVTAGFGLRQPGARVRKPAGEVEPEGDWKFGVVHDGNRLGLQATLDHKGTKINSEFHVTYDRPKFRADLTIRSNAIEVARDPQVILDGIQSIGIKIDSGSGQGLRGNGRWTVDVPAQLVSSQLLIYGVPMTLKVGFKLSVATAFSAKNSTLSAEGEWSVHGPIGGGKPPTLGTLKSITNSIRGTSLGINGFVWGAALTVKLGFGILALSAGPYAKLAATVGLTLGSDLAIVRCQSATLNVAASAGIGVDASEPAKKALGKVLGTAVDALKKIELKKHDIYRKTRNSPPLAICGG